MPRKRPDLTPFYPDKDGSKIDGVMCRIPYWSSFSWNSQFILKDKPSTQRMIKCQGCGTIVPRQIPRLWFNSSYSHQAGHYCMSCGISRIRNHAGQMRSHIKDIEDLIKLDTLVMDNAEKVLDDKRYKEQMALGKMVAIIGKQKRDY